MWNPRGKRKDEKTSMPIANSRIHIEQPLAVSVFQNNLNIFLSNNYDRMSELIILCIGTDRSTGDSLGPITGTKLVELGLNPKTVYGTLEEPVHAVNLQDTIHIIRQKHKRPFIIAIDACLGRSESVGYISIKEGPLQPGTGVNKDLPAVGDLQVIGIVNIGGFMEYMVLQNTRLSLVMKMAEIISDVIHTSLLENGKW
jgi:putative sporulation protein YyaC